MIAKFHKNNDGLWTECGAQKGKCPFSEHKYFASIDEVKNENERIYAEKSDRKTLKKTSDKSETDSTISRELEDKDSFISMLNNEMGDPRNIVDVRSMDGRYRIDRDAFIRQCDGMKNNSSTSITDDAIITRNDGTVFVEDKNFDMYDRIYPYPNDDRMTPRFMLKSNSDLDYPFGAENLVEEGVGHDDGLMPDLTKVGPNSIASDVSRIMGDHGYTVDDIVGVSDYDGETVMDKADFFNQAASITEDDPHVMDVVIHMRDGSMIAYVPINHERELRWLNTGAPLSDSKPFNAILNSPNNTETACRPV